MIYRIEIKKQVEKTLQANKVLRERFEEWRKNLEIAPYNANDGMMIGEYYDGLQVYKKRIGDYRALFVIRDEDVLVTVYKLAPRGGAYKK